VLAANILVPTTKWQGTPFNNSSDVVTYVVGSTSPEKTIGILPANVYDGIRSQVTALAYRTFQQRRAYFPDSTSKTRDKRNVRDGHYTLWSQGSSLSPTTSRAAVQYLLGLLTDTPVTPAPDFDPLATVIGAGFVPTCAMTVTRSVEGGD